jgi:hypothetical protein
MALLIGILLALAVGVFATTVGFDRDRAFYPTVMIVIAFIYSLFAIMGGSTQALIVEGLIGLVFVAAAVVGFRSSLWIVAIALAAHGIYDFLHAGLVSNPGMPSWWPQFCAAYDITAAGFLAWLLRAGRSRAVA